MTKADATERAIELIQSAVGADGFDDLSAGALPVLAELTGADAVFLHVSDLRHPVAFHGTYGLLEDTAAAVEAAYPDWLDRLGDEPAAMTVRLGAEDSGASFVVHPLPIDGRVIGIVGLSGEGGERRVADAVWSRLLATLGFVVDRLVTQTGVERKLLHLNTYLTVSSMLAKSVDLAEMLEISLYCSMEAASAEAASILLLDEEQENFRFYRVEGVAKPLLGGHTFPATEGVAGRVLETREAEIVNDVEVDPQFYGRIDKKTGYQTRSMIAVPLVAGDEPVGVLEVLNRIDGAPFTADERLILVSVADEIAFAVRNATIFDYVVNTYCKRRQGENSCKGCERPLGSWTPCMRYREFLP